MIGVAGIGKSRLAWEFDKYTDGLIEEIWWHKGRCLPYGEGIAYWALAEMLRMRAGIAEDEEPAAAQAKLRVTIETHVTRSRGAGAGSSRGSHTCSAWRSAPRLTRRICSPRGASSSSA